MGKLISQLTADLSVTGTEQIPVNDAGVDKRITVDQIREGLATDDELTAGLASKANTIHTHGIGDTTGLQAALDAKAATSHSHAISDTTGLQAALDAKAASSHTHAISNVTGLQAALDAKAPLASPGLTGTPTAPTAAPGTNTTQIASTAFVAAAVAAGGGSGGGSAISLRHHCWVDPTHGNDITAEIGNPGKPYATAQAAFDAARVAAHPTVIHLGSISGQSITCPYWPTSIILSGLGPEITRLDSISSPGGEMVIRCIGGGLTVDNLTNHPDPAPSPNPYGDGIGGQPCQPITVWGMTIGAFVDARGGDASHAIADNLGEPYNGGNGGDGGTLTMYDCDVRGAALMTGGGSIGNGAFGGYDGQDGLQGPATLIRCDARGFSPPSGALIGLLSIFSEGQELTNANGNNAFA